MRSMFRRTLLLALAAALASPLVGRADEGFWLFNRIPRAAIKQAYGVDLTDAWVTRVQQASIRFPGGSGSFVSPDGLVLTNHHVALQTLQNLSTPERDLASKGYLARDRAQEIKAPDLELLVLQRIDDVTARVNAAVTPSMTAAETLAARRAAIAAIEKEAGATSELQPEMVTLYQGAQYHLYLYKKYTDVRLVFAPEFDAAFFGGDPDNFTFPRYCLDLTIFRVYEHGQPLKVTHYLPWSTQGVKAGEPVFTSGHPGSTQRLNTVAHLEFLRDHALPINMDVLERVRTSLVSYGSQGAEAQRQAKDLVFGIENSLKAWRGQIQGLRDPGLMRRKADSERTLRAAVAANPEFAQRYGDAWDAVAKARRDVAGYNTERVLLEAGLGLFSDYFTHARTLLRWSTESQKPNGERLPEYTDARKALLEQQVSAVAPIHPGVERARLAASLAFMAERLGAGHPIVTQVLAGRSPDQRAADLVAATRMGDAEARKQLFAGGASAVAASSDPFLELARAVEPRSRELRKRYDDEVLAVERGAYARIAQAVFATQGDAAYPDATFTLRLSYGSVKGYQENGRDIEPFTQIRGLYARADEHGMKPPYRYPDSWAKARKSLTLTTPYDFVTTNDIIGGNSGSPVVNARGELVGLVFDGNIQSLPGAFVYDPSVNRAVSVDVRGMTEALRKVYGAEALVSELTAAVATTGR